jgi:hypothetical protein
MIRCLVGCPAAQKLVSAIVTRQPIDPPLLSVCVQFRSQSGRGSRGGIRNSLIDPPLLFVCVHFLQSGGRGFRRGHKGIAALLLRLGNSEFLVIFIPRKTAAVRVLGRFKQDEIYKVLYKMCRFPPFKCKCWFECAHREWKFCNFHSRPGLLHFPRLLPGGAVLECVRWHMVPPPHFP